MNKIILSFVVSLLLFGCTEEAKVEPGVLPISGKDTPSQISYNTKIRFTNEGLLRAILLAGRIQTFDDKHYTLLDSAVKVDFYDREGKHSSILTSKGAKIDNATNNMRAYEDVHIVSDSGTVVDTDTLEWDNQKQTLHSDDPVRIVEANGRITTGVGFESDQSLTHYAILHTTIIAPRDAMDQSMTPTTTSSMAQPAPQTNFGAPAGTPFGFPTTNPILTRADTTSKPKVDSGMK